MAFRDPCESERQAMFRKRIERSKQARLEQEKHHNDIVSMRIAQREFDDKKRRWKERMEFDLYLLAMQILMLLERQRDDNVPSSPEDPWNDKFCEAVRLIPEAKMFFEEMSIVCIRSDNW